jgi:SAM-dependent methyltransferase
MLPRNPASLPPEPASSLKQPLALARKPVAGAWRIAVVAAFILILELAFIRQIPAEVRAIAYFHNLIMMASFFGLGLGCMLQKQWTVQLLLPTGLFLVFALVCAFRGVVIYPHGDEIHYWLMYSGLNPRNLMPLFPAALAMFLAVAIPFVTLGQTLARLMNGHERLVAYSWDIGGSLVGSGLFVASSFLGIPPWVWPPILTIGWAAGFARSWPNRLFTVTSGLAFVWFSQPGQANLESKWSPYYLVQHQASASGTRVYVNSGFHQYGYNFEAANRGIPLGIGPNVAKWDIPYELYRDEHGGRSPGSVLILGAGTGNDVAVALRNKAKRVVAVEIDPVILELGRTTNARAAYADPRVECHVNDARQFLRSTNAAFDLIVFGTLDSQALLSSQGNLRLDNYVYTRESLEDARGALADRGFVAVFYSVQKPWLYERLYATFHSAFGDQSRIYKFENASLFNTLMVGTKGNPRFKDVDEHVASYAHGLVATDDWPFIYLERPTIGDLYRKFIGVVLGLVFAAFLLLRVLEQGAGRHTPFFFLGVGFTLMEAVAIVRLALLFGSTWTVNVVVFVAVLSTVFVANLSVIYSVAPGLRASWIGLCIALAASYLFPVQSLLELALPLRIAASTGLIFVPVYFSSVCFSRLFQREKEVGFPLGLNLVGAMAGGWLEYLSMVFGLRSIWLIALLVYALAWFFTEWSSLFRIAGAAVEPVTVAEADS